MKKYLIVGIFAVTVVSFLLGCSKSRSTEPEQGMIFGCIAFDEDGHPYAYHEGGMARYETKGHLKTVSLKLSSPSGEPILSFSGTAMVDDADEATFNLDVSTSKKSGIKFAGIPKYEATVDGLTKSGSIILDPGQHSVQAHGKVESYYEQSN